MNRSKRFLIRNKYILDTILLSVQASGFLVLAWFVQDFIPFLKLFQMLVILNIIWLSLQLYCLSCINTCYISKLKSLNPENELGVAIQKIEKLSKLSRIVRLWLLNNLAFAVGAGISLSLYFFAGFHKDGLLYFCFGLTFFNSLCDLHFSWVFYKDPEEYFDSHPNEQSNTYKANQQADDRVQVSAERREHLDHLLTHADLEEVFEEIKSFPDLPPLLKNKILLLQGQLKKSDQEFYQGYVSQESRAGNTNRIRKAVLSLINDHFS